MRVAVFSTKPYDRRFLGDAARDTSLRLHWLEARLTLETAALAKGAAALCAFVNDVLDRGVLEQVRDGGVAMVALRCAGFNNVDVETAAALGLCVARVPAYSPYAVAEHAVGLMLTLNRKFHRAHQRVREGNFALEGLLGFDMYGRTVGIVGTGRIGKVAARILNGFGCRLLATDPYPDAECVALGVRYVPLDELLSASDIVTLHCPLTPESRHLIDANAFARMKPGTMLINTSRGGLLDAQAAIVALKSGRLGALGLDVYEEEADLFFEDLSSTVLQDDVFARLLTFPNVLITSHQGFFTEEALMHIARTTIDNLRGFETGTIPEQNLVSPALVRSVAPSAPASR